MTQIEHTKLLLKKHARGEKCPGVGLRCEECPAFYNPTPEHRCRNTEWFRAWLAENDTPKKDCSLDTGKGDKREEAMINTDGMHYWLGHYYEGPTVSGVPAEMVDGRRESVASKTMGEGLEFTSVKPIISREDLRMEILEMLEIERY